jgi:hypothetical protein
MSFVVAAALAIAALMAAPIVAHLLRRGRARERDFPPAALVPIAPPVARQRSRVEDRALLAVRALLIVALALIGATPLVRCSRLSLAREAGASVALALVVDDSLSMRATPGEGATRFELAIGGARELLGSARQGDAVALVLAGRPARLALAATTDLDAVRRALSELRPSDRDTDLDSAVKLARSALKEMPHVDKRVAVLSDLAGEALPPGDPPVWVPLADLARPMSDCAILSAERHGKSVQASVACTSADAARDRRLEIVSSEEARPADASPAAAPGVVASSPLALRAGPQLVALEAPASRAALDARLTGSDALVHDDHAPIAEETASLAVGVLADPATASVVTGGPTILEQALEALGRALAIRPLAVLPDEATELASFALLVIDDPAGITPESRTALGSFVSRGGLALALLGPRAATAQLGSTLEPFATGAVRWETLAAPSQGVTPAAATAKPSPVVGLDPASVSWLGSEGATLADLAPSGRARLDGVEPSDATVIGRWNDGRPFLLERQLGRGAVLSAGLPASVAWSDLALRPGFMALLAHLVDESERRSGPRRSVVGTAWVLPATGRVKVLGPSGDLELRETSPAASNAPRQLVAIPEELGRYRVSIDGDAQLRIATIEADEVLRASRPAPPAALHSGSSESRIDASPELAMLAVLLITLEIAIRAAGALRSRRRRHIVRAPLTG